MSIEQSPGRHPKYVDMLSMREEILVKSASIIEDSSFSPEQWLNLPEGRVFWADWADPIDGTNFQLQSIGERMNPETVRLSYWLRGYDTEITDPVVDFRYDSFSTKISRKNEAGRYKKCKQDDIDMLHGCLASFGTDLSEKEIDTFFGNMQFNEIRDPRLRADIIRTLAKLLPGWWS